MSCSSGLFLQKHLRQLLKNSTTVPFYYTSRALVTFSHQFYNSYDDDKNHNNIFYPNKHSSLFTNHNKVILSNISIHKNMMTSALQLQTEQHKNLDKSVEDKSDSPPAKTELKLEETKTTLAQKLKRAVAEYGATVIVFHVTISLASLGACYLLVSSGLDVTSYIAPLISDETAGKIAANAGTFALAYGVHKVFAPVRIMITLTATPFIVRYLRRIGLLKVNNKKK